VRVVSDDRVRIKRVERLAQGGGDLEKLPQGVADSLGARLDEYLGQELRVGRHVEYFALESFAVRVNVFADTDGTLWVEKVAVS
jgi:hypothetical protein